MMMIKRRERVTLHVRVSPEMRDAVIAIATRDQVPINHTLVEMLTVALKADARRKR
jgi:hypothetical protein